MEDNCFCCDSGCTDIKNRSFKQMLFGELVHHFPFGLFSVSLSLIVLGFLKYLSSGISDSRLLTRNADLLFHSFHYMHIVFAGTGSLVCFFRFSKNILLGLLVGAFSTMFFCTFSDAILPFLAGQLLGVQMEFHLCFLFHLTNVLPFLAIGLLNGLVLGRFYPSKGAFYSVFSHFFHILISSFASTFYIVSHGLANWQGVIGLLFFFLIISVVIPCTMSDIVVPMMAARMSKKKKKNIMTPATRSDVVPMAAAGADKKNERN